MRAVVCFERLESINQTWRCQITIDPNTAKYFVQKISRGGNRHKQKDTWHVVRWVVEKQGMQMYSPSAKNSGLLLIIIPRSTLLNFSDLCCSVVDRRRCLHDDVMWASLVAMLRLLAVVGALFALALPGNNVGESFSPVSITCQRKIYVRTIKS